MEVAPADYAGPPVLPDGVGGPSVDAPSNAHGENSGLQGVGHIGSCSGAFIDVGGDDVAPAYVLTAGHCAGPRYEEPNQVFEGPSYSLLAWFSVNDFWDTRDSPIRILVDGVEYATMHSVDLSIARLAVTVGELHAMGIHPFQLADGAPILGSPISVVGHPGQDVMQRSRCYQGKTTRIVEEGFLWNVTANNCVGISYGSSGSPMFNNAGQIFGVLNTMSGTKHPCTLDNPCDVDSPMQVPMTPIVYGSSVTGLQNCFPSGHFNLEADGCILPRPPLPHLSGGIGRYARAFVNGAPPRWSVYVGSAELPYYRFKAGPVGATRCDVDMDYSAVMNFELNPVITTEIPPTPDVYVLCVHGGTGTDVSTTFTSLNSAAEKIAEVDETPPPLPLPHDDTAGSCFFRTQYPDYMKIYYRVQSRGQSDCSKMPDDTVITQSDLGLVMIAPGQEICATAEDAAGNLSEPETISTANP